MTSREQNEDEYAEAQREQAEPKQEHQAIEAPIFTGEPAPGVIRSINWMLISTNKGEYYIPEAEVYWSLTSKTTKHTHDSLEVVSAVQGG